MQQSNVKVIKANKPIGQVLSENQKIRVAAYCRVSTDGEEQLNSFASQVAYYKDKINENKDWEYVGIYSDEAVTGTKATTRDGFQKMIVDCMDRKIDMVITKSISRFARNTVDTLNYVRKLKNYNVAVFFEEENINTLTMDGELLLTILSSVAQQEVQNTSEHVKKGLKMKLQRGEIIGNPNCLGYNFDPVTKKISINEEEADIVRFIFNKYVEGYGTERICKDLRSMGCKTKRGNVRWESRSVAGIITNEKYKGDLLFGKTVTIDPIEKRRVKNLGQGDQYYFEKHHEPIISDELWEKANRIFKVKSEEAKRMPQCKGDIFVGKYAMSGKIKCGHCNTNLTRRSHMKTTTEFKNVWKCIKSIREGQKFCKYSKSIDEEVLKKGFVQALNMLLVCEDNVLKSFIKTLESVEIQDEERNNTNRIVSEIKTLELRKTRALDAMIDGTISKDLYNTKIQEINNSLFQLNEELSELEALNKKKKTIKDKLKEFSSMIESGSKFDEFDDDVFDAVIHKVIVGGDEEGQFNSYLITYVFNLVGTGHTSIDNYVVVGKFDCDYKHYSFEYDPVSETKVKKLLYTLPCRIALKLE